jgi:hypothetical protein
MVIKAKQPTKNNRSQQIGIRMPLPLLKRIDAFANNLQQQSPGLHISRADAIRVAIENWLAKVEAEEKINKVTRKE